jgi:ADP-heptose:LPS heptosyltransferase
MCLNLTHAGDVLHTVPMLRTLRKQQPQAHIDLMVGPWCREIAEHIPYVDGVLVYCPDAVGYHRGSYTEEAESLWREMFWLLRCRSKGYDLIICAPRARYVERFLCHALRPGVWVGAEWYTNLYASFSDERLMPYDGRQYEATRISNLLATVGFNPNMTGLEFSVTPDDATSANALLSEHQVRGSYVTMTPGAGWPGKMWPIENYKILAEQLSALPGIACIVLTGSKAEFDLCEAVRNERNAIVNLCGRTTWGALAAILENSLVWVGNDSGTMHLAAAVQTPTVSLFGPTEPAKWAPTGSTHRCLKGPQCADDCRPWHPGYECQNNRFCMRSIDYENVYAAVVDLLQDCFTGK